MDQEPQSGRVGRSLLGLAPGLFAVGVFLVWAVLDAGDRPTVWYPGALLLLALLVALALGDERFASGVPRQVWLALGFLGAFAAWSFLSLSWADVRGDAWDGANRTALYVVVYALFALSRWRSRDAAALLGTYALAVAVIGVIAFLRTLGADDPGDSFIGGRFYEPVGYVNGDCALFLTAFWPAVLLSTRREIPMLIRATMLAGAGVLLELALLTQSRGSLFAFPIVLGLYLLLVPGRVRSLVTLSAIAFAAVLAHGTLLDIYQVAELPDADPALRDAAGVIGLSAGGLFVAGLLFAAGDRALRLSSEQARRLRTAVAGVAVLAAVVSCAVGLVALGDPIDRGLRAWDQFKEGQPAEFGPSHFSGGLGSNRYDFWRVAVIEFKRSPVQGIGADNFAVPYLKQRHSSEEPAYPHSLEAMVLSGTGLVGAILLIGGIGAALVAALRLRGRAPFEHAVSAVAVVAFAYWFVHGSVDWFWELPGLGAPAFAWLGMAAGMRPAESSERAHASRRLLPAIGWAGAASFVAISFLLPWIAARDVEEAAASWRSDPVRSFDKLDRARTFNFLSADADLIAGAIALRLDDLSRARRAFTSALDRNPQSWYAYLELGMVSALQGNKAQALEYLRQAEALDPREPAIDLVTDQVRTGKRVSPGAIDRLFIERVEDRTD